MITPERAGGPTYADEDAAETLQRAFVAGSEWALEQYRELLEAAERLSNIGGAFRPTSAYELAIADVMRAYEKLIAAAALEEA